MEPGRSPQTAQGRTQGGGPRPEAVEERASGAICGAPLGRRRPRPVSGADGGGVRGGRTSGAVVGRARRRIRRRRHLDTPRMHAAEVPAVNGIGDARSVARMYAACVGEVDGVRLLTPEQAQRAGTRLDQRSGSGASGHGHPVRAGVHGALGPGGHRRPGLVRPFRVRRVVRMGRSRGRAGHGLRDEPEGHRNH